MRSAVVDAIDRLPLPLALSANAAPVGSPEAFRVGLGLPEANTVTVDAPGSPRGPLFSTAAAAQQAVHFDRRKGVRFQTALTPGCAGPDDRFARLDVT